MTKWNIYTPEGVRDILFDECYVKRNMENRLRNVLRARGFLEIETPTLEFYDVFSPDTGLVSQEDMFKFFDQQGRILVLRPDATIPVARVAATKYTEFGQPLRFSYISNTFRYNELGGGKQKEFTVAGAEIIGSSNPEADAEVLAAAVNSLKKLGVEDFQIDMGQVEFFKGLVQETGLTELDAEQLRVLIDRKDSIGLKELAATYGIEGSLRKLLLGLPRCFGSLEVIDSAGDMTSNTRSLEALENLKEVYSILKDYGLEKYISIDLAMVRNLNFYTGIIFKGYTYDVGFPVLRGGRYDNLVSKFGSDMPATGFSMGLNMVLMAMERQSIATENPGIDTVVCYEEGRRADAVRICRELRKQGLSVEMSIVGADPKVVGSYAAAKGIGGFIRVMDRGVVEVHNIKEGTVEKKTIDQLT